MTVWMFSPMKMGPGHTSPRTHTLTHNHAHAEFWLALKGKSKPNSRETCADRGRGLFREINFESYFLVMDTTCFSISKDARASRVSKIYCDSKHPLMRFWSLFFLFQPLYIKNIDYEVENKLCARSYIM